MAAKKPARVTLIRFLNSNANWREIQQRSINAQRAEDLSTPTLRRYVARLRKAEFEGDWLPDRAALRGHAASENKPRNVAVKPTFADLRKLKASQGTYLLSGPRYSIIVERVTMSQQAVVNFLGRMARVTQRRGYRQVALNIHGAKQGEFAQLLWKGGWKPERLLDAMGYRQTRGTKGKKGRWVKKTGGKGVQKWLLDYLHHNTPSGGTHRWKRIVLYEVYAWNKVIPGDVSKQPLRNVQPLRLNTR